MRRNLILIPLALLIAISLVVIGCQNTSTMPQTTNAIKIGLLLDYSGMGSFDIPYHEKGVRLKLDEIGWEIEGRSIELVTADNAGDPMKGIEAVEKLVQVDKVDVIIGPVWGHVQLAIAPILAKSKTPILVPAGSIIDVVKTCPENFFLTRGTFAGNAYYSGIYASEEMGYHTAVALYDDFATGEVFLNGFTQPFEERGGTIVQTVKPPLGTIDFAPFLSNLKHADVVAIWIQPPELPTFYKQYDEFGLDMPIIYTSITAQSESWAEVGDYCLDTIGQHEYSVLIDNDANRKFTESLQQKGIGDFVDYYESGYTQATIFLEAVKTTNGDTTHEKINEAIRNISVDTPEGKISFDSEGVGIGNEYIVKIIKVDGRYEKEVLKTYEQVARKAPWE